MEKKLSRRNALKLGGLALASSPLAGMPQTTKPSPALAKPLDSETKKIYESQIKQGRDNAAERLKYRLPDCSEPGTVYVVAGGKLP